MFVYDVHFNQSHPKVRVSHNQIIFYYWCENIILFNLNIFLHIIEEVCSTLVVFEKYHYAENFNHYCKKLLFFYILIYFSWN